MKDLSKIDINKIRLNAEKYYREGDFYCSEAIVKAIKEEFEYKISDKIIAMASGFPVGLGAGGCMCGAVAGGVMMLGLFFGRQTAKDAKVNHAMRLSRELHDNFRAKTGSLCCRILTRDMELGSDTHMNQCVSFTGDVAEKTAKIIIREL